MRPSLRAEYGQAVTRGLACTGSSSTPVTEADLAALPGLLQTYLRRAGTLGRPRLRNFRVAFRGAMRRTQEGAWMHIQAEQHTFLGPEPERYFLVRARRAGIPFEGYHCYAGGHATMRVRIASLLQVVDARGPEMDRSEAVTFFNDLCLLAPAALLDVAASWDELDGSTLRGTLRHEGQSVSALLSFDGVGDLADFRSEDRSLTEDGRTYRRLPWSTPVEAFGATEGRRHMHRGEALWHEADGPFSYARFEVAELAFNVGTTP